MNESMHADSRNSTRSCNWILRFSILFSVDRQTIICSIERILRFPIRKLYRKASINNGNITKKRTYFTRAFENLLPTGNNGLGSNKKAIVLKVKVYRVHNLTLFFLCHNSLAYFVCLTCMGRVSYC